MKFLDKGEKGALFLGIDKILNKKVILPKRLREGHFAIFGATRSGKTSRFLIPSLLTDIVNGIGGVYIDPKGDESFLDIYKFLKERNLAHKFKLFHIDYPEISLSYNPLYRGNVLQRAARVMKALEWSEPYYKNVSKEALLEYLKKFEEDKRIPNLKSIFEVFKAEGNKNFAGMTANLSELVGSDFSYLLEGGVSNLDFLEAQKNGNLIYIVVNTDSYLDASRALIRFILLDLMYSANQVQLGKAYRKAFSIHIDEFGDFVVPGFESFLKKCASAGYRLHLSCQSFGDLRVNDMEDFVLSNTFNQLILRQSYPLNTDLAAKLFGSFETHKETYRVNMGGETGEKSVRTVYQLKVDPNLLRSLETGAALFTNRDMLHYLSLPVSPFYRQKGDGPFVDSKEKKLFYKELKEKAECENVASKSKKFNPREYLLKTQSIDNLCKMEAR